MARLVALTGASGFLGQAVHAELERQGYDVLELDVNLLNEHATEAAVARLPLHTPLVHLAYPGGDGIGDAVKHPATLAMNLMRMDLNLIQAAARQHISKVVCIGSVCSYPEHTSVPTCEEALWRGYPEPVNASYGIVKRTQLALLQACRDEYKLNGIHLLLPNLYGPGDRTQHVIPALIRKMRLAKREGGDDAPIVVWGHPEVTRSFLYIADAAAGIVRALDRYDGRAPLNLVQAGETSMATLVLALAGFLDWHGTTMYDMTQPTGHLRRNFSQVNMVRALDWLPPTSLAAGLGKTVNWHLATHHFVEL